MRLGGLADKGMGLAVVVTLAGIALAACGSNKTIITVEKQIQTVTVPETTTQTVTSTDTTTSGGGSECGGSGTSCPTSSGLIYFYADVGVAGKPLVRPGAITFAADGNHTVTGLRWDGWGASVADAIGTDHVNNCKASCAQGQIQSVPANVKLYRPGRHLGRMMYLCYRVSFTVNSPVPGFGYCTSADAPTGPQPNTKCGRNTTYCPVEVDCPIAPGGGPSPHGCYGVVGVSGNTVRPTPGFDKTGLGLDCPWSQPALNADRTVYAYTCDPGP